MRWLLILPIALVLVSPGRGSSLAAQGPAAQEVAGASQSFTEWLAGVIAEAKERGLSDTIIEKTLVGLEPLTRVIQNDRSQAESTPGFGRYLSSRLSDARIARGREMRRTHAQTLARIEDEFGVQSRFLLAIWGLETSYGRNTGNTPIFQALATLAWEPRRAAFFRGELFNALSMVDLGYIEPAAMTGSWAGAMGMPQFMPSSYLKFAVDFDGDGRRDIWRSAADTLASIASYLKGHGWNGEYTWGREVRVPAALRKSVGETIPSRTGGCSARRTMTEHRPLAEWQDRGIRLAGGGNLPNADITASLVDTGERTFLVYDNYDAILGYNCAHYYALTVALLAERLR